MATNGAEFTLITWIQVVMVVYIIYPSNYNKGWGYNMQGDSNFGSTFYITEIQFWNHPTSSRLKRWKLQTSSDNSSYSDVAFNAGGFHQIIGSTILVYQLQ